jgi:thiol-disulfide isomerase/thioredoxin
MHKAIGRRAVLKAATACIVGATMSPARHTIAAANRLPDEGPFPSLHGATGWINSRPLTAADLRGKVVLVDFWTYTCINWLRTLPYLRTWAAQYKNAGLVVLGVHTPEFSFEKDVDNVRWAVNSMTIAYPVAIDSDHAVWRAFNNQYWPALYMIDKQGRIRYHYFGEGAYEQSERIIQQLLSEDDAQDFRRDLVTVNAVGLEAAADWNDLKSPENYLGYERTTNFASATDALLSKSRRYAVPAHLRLNQWALSGDWTLKADASALSGANGRIAYHFHARDVNLVMGPTARSTPVRFHVSVDGQPPGTAHGSDVDENGNGTVREQRVYQLIRQPRPIVDRLFEIEFLDPGVEAYAFTFG